MEYWLEAGFVTDIATTVPGGPARTGLPLVKVTVGPLAFAAKAGNENGRSRSTPESARRASIAAELNFFFPELILFFPELIFFRDALISVLMFSKKALSNCYINGVNNSSIPCRIWIQNLYWE